MTTPTATLDSNGVTIPSYDEVMAYFQDLYRSIYGSDVSVDPDTQDGQFLAALSSAVHDANMAVVDAYNSFSPAFAQGVGLSNVVRINGISRRVATKGTVDVTLTGQAGTTITNGKVQDVNGNLWNLPATVVIGGGGTVLVTATAEEDGDIEAAVGEVNEIATPARGWQSVTNADAAEPGAPVETDADLRRRQALSVSLPALSPIESLAAAVAAVDGVSRSQVYENDTDATDANGIPEHSISAVVQGGDAEAIAQAILNKKTPGTGTYGTTSEVVFDSRGIPSTIEFFNLTEVALKVEVTISDLPGYTAATASRIKAAVALYINRLGIGEDSSLLGLVPPARLSGQAAIDATGMTQSELDALAATYSISTIKQAKLADPFAAADVAIAFNEAATCSASAVTVVVV